MTFRYVNEDALSNFEEAFDNQDKENTPDNLDDETDGLVFEPVEAETNAPTGFAFFIAAYRKIPPLTSKEKEEIYRCGPNKRSPVLTRRLIESHLYLLSNIARDCMRNGFRAEDLENEGYKGLQKAAQKFNPKAVEKINTENLEDFFRRYATYFIKGYITRHISHRHNRLARPEYTDSLHEPVAENGDDRIVFVRAQTRSPLEASISEQQVGHAKEALKRLSPQSQRVLEAQYIEGLSPAEIAKELGVTKKRLAEMESAAMEALRKALRNIGAITKDEISAAKAANSSKTKLDAITITYLKDRGLSKEQIANASPLTDLGLNKQQIANTLILQDLLAQNGVFLSPEIYAQAMKKQNRILLNSPEPMLVNLTGLAEGLQERGITLPINRESTQQRTVSLSDVVAAALKNLQMFVSLSATMLGHIDDTAKLFKKIGFPVDRNTYVEMAFKHPTLFNQDSVTIAHHAQLMQTMVRAGMLRQGFPGDEFGPLVQFLKSRPQLLSIGSENLLLRLVAEAQGFIDPATKVSDVERVRKSKNFWLLRRSRKDFEDEVIDYLTDTPPKPPLGRPLDCKNLRYAGPVELSEAGLLKYHEPKKAVSTLKP